MKRRLDHIWFNVSRLFQWHRVLGISGLCVVAYVLVFVVFGRTDVSGFLPRPDPPLFHWPSLPKFFSEPSDTKGIETIYTVPTRQITAQELAQLPPAPVRPEKATMPPNGSKPVSPQ